MADYNLGTASGTIEINYKGDGVPKAEEDLGRLSKSAESGDAALNKTANTAGIAGAAIAAGVGLAVNAAMGFEQGLANVQSVTGATATEMENLSEKALQIGRDTAYSSAEATDAMFELAKAGISTTDIIDGAADSTIALAAAGSVDLASAATIMSSAMNVFGIEASKSNQVADLLAGTANATATDVSALGEALRNVGPIASATGVSLEDTTTALGLLAQQGISGGRAGTALAATLRQLNPQSRIAQQALQDLGLITEDGTNKFFDANGEMKSMAEVSQLLQDATSGLTAEQRQLALTTIFGQEGFAGANALAAAGAEDFSALAGSIGEINAADVAAAKLDSLSGQLTIMKGSLETAAIVFGQIFLPVLTDIVQAITGVINWFAQLSPGVQKTIMVVVAFVGAGLLMVAALIKVVQFVKAARIAMVALNATFLANPITLIILAIVALVAAIVLLWQNSETFRNIVTGVWNAVKAAVQAVVDWFTGTAVPWLQSAWDSISTGAQSLWAKIVEIWTGIKDAISLAMTTIQTVLSVIWAVIVAIVTTYINLIRTVITTVMNAIMAVWNAVWGVFGPLVTAVWELIKTVVQVGIHFIRSIISSVMNAIQAIWDRVWRGIQKIADAVWTVISTIVTTYINIVRTVITTVLNAVRSVWTSVWNAIRSFVTSIWNSIRSAIEGPLNAINSKVTSVVSAVRNFITSGFNAAKNAVTVAFNLMRSVISERLNAIKSNVTGVIDTIRGFFSGAGDWLVAAGRNLIEGLARGIRNAIGAVTGAITSVTDKLKGFLPGSPIEEGPLKDAGWNEGRPGEQLVEDIALGIDAESRRAERVMEDLARMMAASFNPPGIDSAAVLATTPVEPWRGSANTDRPTFSFGDISVTVPLEDLAGLETLEDFLEMLSARTAMENGVTV